MTRYLYLPLGGTIVGSAPDREWRQRGSAFDCRARSAGFSRVDIDGDPSSPDPFVWNRAVNGLLIQQLFGRSRKDWRAGAGKLWECHDQMAAIERVRAEDAFCKVHTVYPRPIVWFAHSHAGTVAALALSLYGPLEKRDPPAALVSLDMPVRRNMEDVYRRIRYLYPTLPIIHLHSHGAGWSSRFRYLGSRWNGTEWPIATKNIPVEGGHSRFLSHPRYLPQWDLLFPRIRQIIENQERA